MTFGHAHDHSHDHVHGAQDGVPLTDTTRFLVMMAHFLIIPAGLFMIYAFYERVDRLRAYIWSPFLVLVGITMLQLGSWLEIADHHYDGNFELKDVTANFVNGMFYSNNFAAIYILAIGMRSLARPISQSFTSPIMVVELIGDFISAIGIPLVPIVYATLGRDAASSGMTAFTALAGILLAYRLGASLGGSCWMYLRGLTQLVLTNLAVIIFAIYRSNGIEYLHMFIGGSFISSTVPMSLCWWYLPPPSKDDGVPKEPAVDTELAKGGSSAQGEVPSETQ